MKISPAVAWYRALLRLYPRRFREEYGPDMVLLLTDQLRDERPVRVLARAAVDLAITVPSRHLEARMNRPANPVVPLLAVAVIGVLVALVGGSSLGMLGIGLSVAVVAAALAVVARRQSRPVVAAPTTAHWWKFLAAGVALLAVVVAVTTATGEVPSSMWWPTMLVVLCALGLVAVGIAYGIAHRIEHRTLRTR